MNGIGEQSLKPIPFFFSKSNAKGDSGMKQLETSSCMTYEMSEKLTHQLDNLRNHLVERINRDMNMVDIDHYYQLLPMFYHVYDKIKFKYQMYDIQIYRYYIHVLTHFQKKIIKNGMEDTTRELIYFENILNRMAHHLNGD